MDFTRRTKSKKGAVFWTGQPQEPSWPRWRGLLPAGVLGGFPELGAEQRLRGPACWNGAPGTTAEEEAGDKLGQFFAIL